MSFFVFHILELKIVPIDSELNSGPGNIKLIFLKKVGVVPGKAAKHEKGV